ALIAVVFVAGNLGSLLHEATERHARCPEHGELMHVEAAAPGAAGEDARDVAALARPSSDSSEHEHEHCFLCPSSRERACLGPIHAAALAPVARFAPPPARAESAPRARHVYALAPKNSPPPPSPA